MIFTQKPKHVQILVLLLFASCFGVCDAGTIVGKVKAEGKAEAQQDISSGKYESRKWKFVERLNYGEFKDFVVYIDQPIPGSLPPTEPLQVIIQKNAVFVPHILPVMVGTTVEWPNHDDIFHNVFSMSEPKSFDLGLYKSNETKRVTFDKPGRVDVFCSIHTKMNCIVLVLQSPFFSVTDEKGFYKISNVPPGRYKLTGWHERMPLVTKEIEVPATGEVKADLTLTISGLPKY